MLLGAEPAADGVADALTTASARLFVLPIHDAVQIYRDVRGPEAV